MIVQHLEPRPITPGDDGQYFFGYFDRSPYRPEPRPDGSAPLLAHRVNFLDRFPSATDHADLGLIDPDTRAFEPIARSHAWNWQQGSHVQWLKDPADPSRPIRIIFNDRRNTQAVSVVIDESGQEQRVLPRPIVAISRDGARGACVEMGRLTRLRREYGLPGIDDPNPGEASPADDGLRVMDLASGSDTLVASMAELASFGVEVKITQHQHVNHALFNPSGTRLCFMHRFERDDGIMHSRLFTVGVDGTGLRLLFEGLVSHYDWLDDGTILAWAGRRGLLGGGTEQSKSPLAAALTLARKGLKPVYYALGKPRFLMNKILKDAYHAIPDAEPSEAAVFAKGELITDGHCTLSPRSGWVLTDGYPDSRGRQPLYLAKLRAGTGSNAGPEAEAVYEIGRFPTPRHLDGEIRVDLHPRFDPGGSRVCIDSAMDGRRRMYELDITPVLNR